MVLKGNGIFLALTFMYELITLSWAPRKMVYQSMWVIWNSMSLINYLKWPLKVLKGNGFFLALTFMYELITLSWAPRKMVYQSMWVIWNSMSLINY